MKKKIALLFVLILVIAVAALIYVKFAYFTEGHKDPLKSEDKINITAKKLFSLYSQYEDSANKMYLDSVISVSGNIQNIELNQDRYTITLNSEDSSGAVICEMDVKDNEKMKQLKKGIYINLVGYCNGILIDVQLDRCKLAD